MAQATASQLSLFTQDVAAERRPETEPEKWSPRKTLVFVVTSSAALWGVIITTVLQFV